LGAQRCGGTDNTRIDAPQGLIRVKKPLPVRAAAFVRTSDG
jgi:hypothetical protein